MTEATERLLGPRDGAPPRRKTLLKDRRAERIARSRRSQQDHLRDKAAAATTPLDLYEVAYSTLRGRLVQLQRKADNAVDRATEAGDQKRIAAARRRQAEVCGEAEKVCSRVIAYLEKQADLIDTTRR